MPHPNLEIINRFHEAYSKRNMEDLKLVLAENARWIAFGETSYSKENNGFDEVVAFFETLGTMMRQSDSRVEKLIERADDQYVLECLRIHPNIQTEDLSDQLVCILWKLKDSKIIEGRLFFAEPDAAENFISYISAYQ